MNTQPVTAAEEDVRRLLCAANPEAALLYIYLHAGNNLGNAGEELHMSQAKLSCAAAVLRQLGLWQEEKHVRIAPGEPPSYSENDVLNAMHEDESFQGLYGEVQRLLGRNLNTEELKILLGFVRYLGLPGDVITVLICYCRERARQKGSNRNPSLRTIEKEAYHWAERGIDTMEEAAAYIQNQNLRRSRLSEIMGKLQIRGRSLTAAEEKYAQQWIEMGFSDEVIGMAYERTCLNTGGLSWPYMNKILTRWHEQGMHTAQAVGAGEKKTDNSRRELDADEAAAIRRMMQEG